MSGSQSPSGVLVIHTDGGSRGNPGPAAIGVHAELDGSQVFETSAVIGEATNNTAEYQAVIRALVWLKGALPSLPPIRSLEFVLDSKLVVEQLSGRFKIKQPHIIQLVRKVRLDLQAINRPYRFRHVPREQNTRADELVNQALDAN